MSQVPVEAAHLLAVPGALPRRTRLTVSNGQGKPVLRAGINDTDRTWLTILPLESHCYAVRLGFANPFHEAMPIIGASVFPSDSYNPVAGALVPGTSVGVPTGGAAGSTVFFDRAGLDSSHVSGAGRAKGLILPGDPGNSSNRTAACAIAWSDWAPVRSVLRADGGSNPLLFIYVALSRGSMSTAGFGPNPFLHAMSVGCRGRVAVSLRGTRSGDWTANLSGTEWGGATAAPRGNGSQWGLSPLFCLQYLSIIPGVQGVLSGDSLMCGPGGPTGDGFSAAPIRAAYDLSSVSRPICMAHLACGGESSLVYNETLLRNLGSLRPSFLVLQPLSRNDGMSQENLDVLFAKLLATCDMADVEYGARTMYQGAYPIPSVDPGSDGHTAALTVWHNVCATLTTMEASGILVYDATSLIGDDAAPWRYREGYSDDATHPNDRATEAITPTVCRLLQRMLSGESQANPTLLST